jgi:2-oxoglutarate ferredoxin oxidoreductase subunit alpha
MQESFSEITLAELPLVVFDMARGQGDYFQATRGGGHGDYRHIVLAPVDIGEAVELTQLAFHLADRWRNPVLVMGDYLLAHTSEAVDVDAGRRDDAPADKPWALDGSLAGTGRSRSVTPLGLGKFGQHERTGIEDHLHGIEAKLRDIEAQEVRVETGWLDGAEHLVVAFGTPAKFVRYVVAQLRGDGVPVGFVRPITLWPFPYDTLGSAAGAVRSVLVFETNAGQMIDDVRIAVAGRAPVRGIGGISTDGSGFGVGSLLDADVIRRRVLAALESEPMPV